MLLSVVYGVEQTGLPTERDFERWASGLDCVPDLDGEVVLRIVGEPESAALNEKWRGKTGPTNVLSFPCDDPRGVSPRLLGDIAICAPLVSAEAERDKKTVDAHWAHLLVHGVLHLLGHDHLDDAEALEMERLERRVLSRLGIGDPYAERT